jgi:hypothetical protein
MKTWNWKSLEAYLSCCVVCVSPTSYKNIRNIYVKISSKILVQA